MKIELADIHLTENNATLPVSLVEMKQHLNMVGFDADDDLITSYIKAACDFFEGPQGFGFVLMRKTYEVDLDRLPERMTVTLSPLVSVTATPAGETFKQQPVHMTRSGQVIFFASSAAHTLVIEAGHDTAADIPADIKLLIKQLVADWYQTRETFTSVAVNKLPIAADAILNKYRRY